MKLRLTVLIVLLSTNYSISQNLIERTPDGGGEFIITNSECITPTERVKVNQQIERNIKAFGLKRSFKKMNVLYDWPIQQNPNFDYNSTYAISNYVDHDPSYPNQLEDYNCGSHTYDTNSGYNHQGIDVYLWPFDHNQVAADQTYVVAAADGIILNKADGNVDNNCSFNSLPANFVILEHSDGSRSWYWHLKNGSVTSKSIGASVVAGEYLGVVASSGNSTGPHLHFECYDSNLNLIDPYAGSCNGMNATSFWNNQKPYWEPTINTVLTHSSPPSFQSCPNQDITNVSHAHEQGALVYFAGYFHDQQNTNTITYEIKDPTGTAWQSWNHNSPSSYRSSWWYWGYYLPSNAMIGTWSWNATLNGQTVSREFYVTNANATNYTCANAEVLSNTGMFLTPFIDEGSGASQGDATHAVWYSFTPLGMGTIGVASCNEGVNSRVWSYSGSCGNLTNLAQSDDDCPLGPGLGNEAANIDDLNTTGSNPILIEWDDKWSDAPFSFKLEYLNHQCSGATEITTAGTYSCVPPYEGSGAQNAPATHSSWYKFVPPATGDIKVSSCASNVNTRVWVYSGACGSLTQIGSGDNDCGASSQSAETGLISVTAGTAILIEWDNRWDSTTPFDFTINYASPCPPSYTAANGNPLTGTQSTTADFETDGDIESTQIIDGNGINVKYDSGSNIYLNPGFEVKLNAIFEAFLDGCSGS